MRPEIFSLLTRLRGRQLALVVALDEARSLHRAAHAIATTQPAATKMLREIEEMFGVPLYERLPRGLEPTEYGQLVAQYARLVLIDLGQLQEQLANVRAGGKGSVEAGAIMAAVPRAFVAAVTRLTAEHPQIKVKLQMDTSDVLVPLLLQSQLDVVIGRVPDDTPSATINFEPLDEERLCVVCGADNPLAKVRKLKLSMVATHPWVLQSAPSPMRLLVANEFADEGKARPNVVVETSSILTMLSLLQVTDMLSVTPETVANLYMARGLIAVLPIRLRRSLPPYGVLTRRGRWVPPSVQLFIDVVRKTAESKKGP
jgi:DNA-binding transcriptional LysR family regulator